MKDSNYKLDDSFFDDDFSIDEKLIDEEAVGILGPNASPLQELKYEMCCKIKKELMSRGLSNNEAGIVLGVNGSEVSRIMNLRIDRFTVDQLMKFSLKIFDESKISQGISAFVKFIA